MRICTDTEKRDKRRKENVSLGKNVTNFLIYRSCRRAIPQLHIHILYLRLNCKGMNMANPSLFRAEEKD